MKTKERTLIFASIMALVGLFCHCVSAQQIPDQGIAQNYEKLAVMIPMRDGTQLHTTVYSPRDRSQKYPFMMNRTPYSTQPYGEGRYPFRIAPSKYLENEKYIFVHQDVRGRWMSEGKFDNMRPHVAGETPIDESSDTYDTIEWLLKNVPNHNGKVGIWGISYPGFYAAAALPEHHPALVASSPQAPIADFFFDDFHHHGAYLQSYFIATAVFGYQHNGPTPRQWYRSLNPTSQDAWNFHMNLGPMSQAGTLYDQSNFFWQQLVEHPNYDEFWQKRSILPHLKNVKTNVMVVGGLFDAEDLYGPFNIYRELEKNNPGIFNMLVMGPWSHGDWSRVTGEYTVVGKISFGKNVSDFYQREIEAPFFRHFLKGIGDAPKYEALMFDTGIRKWRAFSQWPPAQAGSTKYYLRDQRQLATNPPTADESAFSMFVSDPADPVPYRDRADITLRFTPRPYMSDDQRFASARDDVLVFQSAPLERDTLVTGDILAHLNVSTTGSAADWVVKLIDVYPEDHPFVPGSQPGLDFGGIELMVRSEVIRGRFRNGYEKPEPFTPDAIEEVNLPLQDICHTFRKGHRIMVHVQSTWFPLIDRNPQKFVPNIFKAEKTDFIRATHRVFHKPDAPSWLELKVFDENDGQSSN
jgi:putative CocE/NonD family hydrolase